jgi:hypothetical protein
MTSSKMVSSSKHMSSFDLRNITHIQSVVVDDEQTVAKTMSGGDIQWTSKVRGQVEKGTGNTSYIDGLCWASVDTVGVLSMHALHIKVSKPAVPQYWVTLCNESNTGTGVMRRLR